MRAVEMKYKFDMKMRDLLHALNHPFTTHEINRFINEAQLNICRRYADQYEKDENVRQIMSVLVKPFKVTTFTTDTNNFTNGVYADANSQMLNLDCLSIANELVNNTIKVKPTTHDEYSVNKDNPFKKPYSKLVWRIDRKDLKELITDGTFTITKYSGDYIDYPADIDIDNDVDCILTAQIHEDIVNEAVAIALNVINRTAQMLNPKSKDK